jgi:integrase
MIDRQRTATGVDVSAHTFRRALATRWLVAGGGQTALRSLAGWRSPAMVGMYTRMSSEQIAHAEHRRLPGPDERSAATRSRLVSLSTQRLCKAMRRPLSVVVVLV